jgi:polyisoprenyl-phosphate glycosyltransferase
MNAGTSTENPTSASGLKLVIVIPVYNDWDVANLLLQQIDLVCVKGGLNPTVLLVNDGSTLAIPDNFLDWRPKSLVRVDVLDLYKNLGHQRAICIAMVHLCQDSPDATVLVMDADGEDPPEQIPCLIKTYLDRDQKEVVFAARRRRMEGFAFRVFYQLYRLVHLLLVGSDIRIGNFSILPPTLVARLTRSSDLWNHYAASVVKSKLPMTTIPIDRAKRLKGRSKMGYVGLVSHGLSAMSVYSDIIGVRIMMWSGVLLSLGLAALIAVVVLRFSTNWAIPGWATNLFSFTLVLMFQVVIICLLFTFAVLASRGGQAFIPIRDCPHFVMSVRGLEFKHA